MLYSFTVTITLHCSGENISNYDLARTVIHVTMVMGDLYNYMKMYVPLQKK